MASIYTGNTIKCIAPVGGVVLREASLSASDIGRVDVKCIVKSSAGEVLCAGRVFGIDPVIADETPEILYYLAMGWLQRCAPANAAEPAKPEASETPAPGKIVRRKAKGV